MSAWKVAHVLHGPEGASFDVCLEGENEMLELDIRDPAQLAIFGNLVKAYRRLEVVLRMICARSSLACSTLIRPESRYSIAAEVRHGTHE